MQRKICLIALLLIGCVKNPPHETLAPTSRIEGLVYEEGATNAIPGIAVMAYDKYGTFVSGDVTNMRGRYSISNIPAGNYIVRIHSGEYGAGEKYSGEYYKNAYSWENANPVTVQNNIVTTGINFLLDKGTTLTGRLLEKNTGTPIPNNMFFLKIYSSKEDYITYFSETDSLGKYAINGIEPGKYTIRAEPDDWIGSFFSDSSIIIKNTFDTLKGLDFLASHGGAISGKVTPSTQLWIQIIGTSKSLEKQADAEGNYLVGGLPPGKYVVRAYPFPKTSQYAWQYWKNSNSETKAITVTVTGTDTTKNVDFSLAFEGIISGIIKGSNGIPIENCDFELYDIFGDKVIEPTVSNTAGGYYEIHNLPPGEYVLRVSKPGYHGEYYKDAYNFEESKHVLVTLGTATPNINFELEPAGQIRGYVLCNNNLISGDSIRFNILAVNTKTKEIFAGRSTFTGGYKIPGLPAADYKMFAFAPESEFSAIWAGGGVSVNDSKTSAIPVTLDTPVDFNISMAPRIGQISGMVYDLDTITISARDISYDTLKTPLVGGNVIAYDSDGYIVQVANCTEKGYVLKGLSEGKYFLKTSRFKGFKDLWYKGTPASKSATSWTAVIPQDAVSIELKDSESLPSIDFIVK